jgi:hypothetical protein
VGTPSTPRRDDPRAAADAFATASVPGATGYALTRLALRRVLLSWLAVGVTVAAGGGIASHVAAARRASRLAATAKEDAALAEPGNAEADATTPTGAPAPSADDAARALRNVAVAIALGQTRSVWLPRQVDELRRRAEDEERHERWREAVSDYEQVAALAIDQQIVIRARLAEARLILAHLDEPARATRAYKGALVAARTYARTTPGAALVEEARRGLAASLAQQSVRGAAVP